ncbi:ComEC/Rec2 family competence protein [Bacteroidota bacterium]
MKINLKLYPAVRLLAIAAAGILVGSVFCVQEYVIMIFLGISIVLLFSKKFQVLSYYIICLTAGIWFSGRIDEASIKTPDKIIQEFPAMIDGKIVKTMKKYDSYAKFIVEGSIDSKPLDKLENQRIILTVYGLNYRNIDLDAGSHIFALVNARPPKKPILPNDFPENQYTASLEVKWIARASSKNISITYPPGGFDYFREKQVKSIQQRISELFPESSVGVVTALLTGDKTKIDYETKQLFSLSGTAHVLAVSGLHVGIIATMVYFLLGFVRNKWIKFVIFSILIITFVLITGMQTSAMRAGIMAILFLFAKTLQRHSTAINIIALAIILLIYPEMIYSVGFHMSVSAITGIAILFNPIMNFFKSLIKTENIIVKYILSSVSISLAASIVVSPIVAYYFNIYSIISPLANLFVIPAMTLGMCFSILALLFSYIYFPVGILYASSAGFLIHISQEINNFAVNLPMAYLEGEYLILIAVLFSAGIIYMIFSKNFKQFSFRIVVSSFIFLIALSYSKTENDNIVIYPREQYIAIDFPVQKGAKSLFLIDRVPAQKPSRDFAMENQLKDINENLVIYYSGNAGLNIVDNLKRLKEIKAKEMSIDFQKRLKDKLGIDDDLPQIIDLNYELNEE